MISFIQVCYNEEKKKKNRGNKKLNTQIKEKKYS